MDFFVSRDQKKNPCFILQTIPPQGNVEIFLRTHFFINPQHQERTHMNKHLAILVTLIMIASVFPLMSGCTEQDKTITPETLQTILEKAAIIESVTYDIHTEILVNGEVHQTTVTRIWQQLPYLKEEENRTAANITTTQRIIQRPDGLYLYDDVVQSYQLNPQALLPAPSTVDLTADLLNNQTLTIIGTENFSGKPTTVIQYSPRDMGNTTTRKLWIWNEKGVMLQAVSITQANEITETTTATYSNYSFEHIPESLFSVE